jgi:hypothetical protein
MGFAEINDIYQGVIVPLWIIAATIIIWKQGRDIERLQKNRYDCTVATMVEMAVKNRNEIARIREELVEGRVEEL